MKVPLCTSVVSVFIELQNLFSADNDSEMPLFRHVPEIPAGEKV